MCKSSFFPVPFPHTTVRPYVPVYNYVFSWRHLSNEWFSRVLGTSHCYKVFHVHININGSSTSLLYMNTNHIIFYILYEFVIYIPLFPPMLFYSLQSVAISESCNLVSSVCSSLLPRRAGALVFWMSVRLWLWYRISGANYRAHCTRNSIIMVVRTLNLPQLMLL